MGERGLEGADLIEAFYNNNNILYIYRLGQPPEDHHLYIVFYTFYNNNNICLINATVRFDRLA